jgi:hypothetical protein
MIKFQWLIMGIRRNNANLMHVIKVEGKGTEKYLEHQEVPVENFLGM